MAGLRPVWSIAGLRRWDVVAITLAGVAIVAILVNVLLMQSGSHPAPMFKGPPPATKPAASKQPERPRLAEQAAAPSVPPAASSTTSVATSPAPAKPAARMPGEIITDIQRELARRGFYDGAVDGLYGPRTDGAIRDFEQANGLKPSTEPSEALLAAIMRPPVRSAARTAAAPPSTPAASARPPLPVRAEAPARKVIALQRALADYGYGQLRPSGVVDAETQAAIERFERERRLPVTGQPSDRVLRELAALTGRPLE